MVTHKAWKKNLLIKYLCPRDFRCGKWREICLRQCEDSNKKLSEEKCIEILTNEPHGVLSLISDTDTPMVFLLHIGTMKKTDTSIFMEQKVGHKMDCLKQCDKASFLCHG